MAAERKLKAEIQQTLKKAEEGIEIFDDVLAKVYSSELQNQKEKYETELKKEIKKLQRHRDDIKTWLGSNEVKDKDQLAKMRKRIEERMEQFKACEKDTKVKAYSREGLARDIKADPQDAEREEKMSWVNEQIERLNVLIDKIEGEKEKLSRGKIKTKDKEQIEKFDNRIKKVKWHKGRMDLLLEKLEDLDFNPDSVDDTFKEMFEDYISNADDDDGELDVTDEFTSSIYEDFHLDGEDDGNSNSDGDEGGGVPESTTLSASGGAGGGPSTKPDPPSTVAVAGPKLAAVKAVPVATTPTVATTTLNNANTTTTSASNKVGNTLSTPAVTLITGAQSKQSATAATATINPKTAPVAIVNAKAVVGTNASLKSDIKGSTANTAISPAPASSSSSSKDIAPADPPKASDPPPNSWLNTLAAKAVVAPNSGSKPPVVPTSSAQASTSQPQIAGTVVQSQPTTVNAKSSPVLLPKTTVDYKMAVGAPDIVVSNGNGSSNNSNSNNYNNNNPFTSTNSNPNIFENMNNNNINSNNSSSNVPSKATATGGIIDNSNPFWSSLSQSALFLSSDNQQQHSSFTPNQFISTPISFPQQPLESITTPEFFDKLLPLDTIYFAFYHQPGSYSQYLASRRLKSNSWRFHKQFHAWFQRFEEPRIKTNEYEEGTYKFFDFENTWGARLKQDFRMEYSLVEE